MASPSLLAFGSQTSLPQPQYLSQLRASLLLKPVFRNFLEAIKHLPEFWLSLVREDPRLEAVPGKDALDSIGRWLDNRDLFTAPGAVPNVLCTPFTVIIHIIQYLQFLGEHEGLSHSQILENSKRGGVQGFCTGLLVALVVACSEDEEAVAQLGGVALRLAVAIGAYVDLEGAYASPPNEAACMAVRWKDDTGRDKFLESLQLYPEAYISVVTDSTSVTVTTSKSTINSLSQALSSQCLTTKTISLEGRFHLSSHEVATKKLNSLCERLPTMQLPNASELRAPVRSNVNAEVISEGSLHKIVIEALLTQFSNWYMVMLAATSQLMQTSHASILQVGMVDCIPASIMHERALNITKIGTSSQLSAPHLGGNRHGAASAIPSVAMTDEIHHSEHAIAVIGMACKFPEAESPNEFWELLDAGTSTLAQLSSQRFSTEDLRRSSDDKLKFWGNFLRDPDAFDHDFFKKCSREAASMDPQQRLLLQVAYEAMESAGYFGELASSTPPSDVIGVYVGVGAADYSDNIASHAPSAYSALGMLRAFLAGKVSHFFGWTGPSITFDTACSSSAVAIHNACRALESGECSRAVAGGANLFTSPNLYQNLAAASFLSPTGASKPFDAKADGYCRGEGVGLVVLKKLSDAIADGDNILGVIMGSAVNQNHNSTAITVPHSDSQVKLYQKVNARAGVKATDVSYVEGHGTGTQVGDPIEFESIRKVYGGSSRSEPVHVASVKGNIGHLEGASGVAGLIKTILMFQHKKIPAQVNFSVLNPKISPLEPDRMIIPTTSRNWESKLRIACINNYGASGNNAALIVCQPPTRSQLFVSSRGRRKYPIFISANTPASLAAYCSELSKYIEKLELQNSEIGLSSVAFNLATKQNRTLPHIVSTTVSSLSELKDVLRSVTSGSTLTQIKAPTISWPVVLAFGGQVKSYVGLSKDFYNESTIFRSHLDHCDSILRSSGYEGLYPHIFSNDPVDNVVGLQCQLFSVQYSCAKSWLDSGLKVDALVGHSFGQLTALCVSGSMPLGDGVKFVAGRASLIHAQWGPERGSMISIQANLETVLNVMSLVEQADFGNKLEIACYNGPSSHVLVGTESSIKAAEDVLAGRGIRSKKLNVTHGFHSEFSEPLLPDLTKLAEAIKFGNFAIPLETCSEQGSWSKPEARLMAEHTRTPVYFNQAIDRLSNRLGPCVWLEAGFGSSITNMIKSILDTTERGDIYTASQLHFDHLADATVDLWKAGHKAQFWSFHRKQTLEYTPLMMPSYQFQKTSHWLKFIDTAKETLSLSPPAKIEAKPELLSFVGFKDRSQRVAEFSADPRSEAYQIYVKGHAVLDLALCPASLYLELVAQAAAILAGSSEPSASVPCIDNLDIKSPLGLNDHAISITLKSIDGQKLSWSFGLSSKPRSNKGEATGSQQHASGKISLDGDSLALTAELDRYERLIGNKRYCELMLNPQAEALQGNLIYKVFGKFVNYKYYYRGVKSVFAKDHEVAGLVSLPQHNFSNLNNSILQPVALDNFIQVAGIHVNCLKDMQETDVYICTSIGRTQLSPKFGKSPSQPNSWVVYSSFHQTSKTDVTNDIFVFDQTSNALAVMILDAKFTKLPMVSLAKMLSRVNAAGPAIGRAVAAQVPSSMPVRVVSEKTVLLAQIPINPVQESNTISPSDKIESALIHLLHEVTDCPINALQAETTVDDLGIDSLMLVEVLAELKKAFDVDISPEDFQNLEDLKSLTEYLRSKGATSDETSGSYSPSELSASPSTAASSVSDNADLAGNLAQLAQLVAGFLEASTELTQETNLAEHGIDSLSLIELANDIRQVFDVEVDISLFKPESTFGDLVDKVMSGRTALSHIAPTSSPSSPVLQPTAAPQSLDSGVSLTGTQQAFEKVRYDYDIYTKQTGFNNFWNEAFSMQTRLVTAYVVEAFASLGCPIANLKPHEQLPPVKHLPKHTKVMGQYYDILKTSSLIIFDGKRYVRSEIPVDKTTSRQIYEEILREYPQHMSEHELLNITGSRLADCLTGSADPLQLLFGSKESRNLLTDVYTHAPMFDAITRLLGSFLGAAFVKSSPGCTYDILELGGGTGGTTAYIVDYLVRSGVHFTFTFTDISGSLVAAARKRFAGRPYMKFKILDVEKAPPQDYVGQFHTVISSNCIHATKNLVITTANIHKMLRPDGFLALVELTKNIPWFDLVFGLLEGWWLFDDGRNHALANEWLWDSKLKTAGFKHVSWSDGPSEEARGLKVITAFLTESENAALKPKKHATRSTVETVVYKQVGETSLYADIYLPSGPAPSKRPIALMIHGGGHIMLSRKDVRPKQTRLLLDKGYLPVSIDYRLCPEINLIDGPMTDVCDALRWARQKLPDLNLGRTGLEIDGSRVAAVGWSTGGHLAMTLAWTSRLKDIQPPEAILAFYCPTDYEAECWRNPNFPEGTSSFSYEEYDLLEAVQDYPITGYNIPSTVSSVGGWMADSDPRSRIALHMNWKGQTLPVLLNGLPHKSKATSTTNWKSLPQPPLEKIIAASPRAQIELGNYQAPTFLVHGTADDLIPWQQSLEVYNALARKGVDAGIVAPEGMVHLFDLCQDRDGRGWEAVMKGYEFLLSHTKVRSLNDFF